MILPPSIFTVNSSTTTYNATQAASVSGQFANDNVDLREQLFNTRQIGRSAEVSLPENQIVDVHGILIDVEARKLQQSCFIPYLATDPIEFYHTLVGHWLCRHDLLRQAEVRSSGRGLHIIVRLTKPVMLNNDNDRRKWSGIVKLLKSAIPSDPESPNLIMLTRPLGSINSKSGTPVTLLQPGYPVDESEVISFADQMRTSPFKTIFKTLTGVAQLNFCPFCNTQESGFVALDYIGKCYNCGKIKLNRLLSSLGKDDSVEVPNV